MNFFNDHNALSFVLRFIGFDLFNPSLNDFVGLVAGFVKLAPHAVIGHAALIGLLPRIAQTAHSILLLAATQGLGHERLRLDDQLFTNLIRAPFLPTFHLASGIQSIAGFGFGALINISTMLAQRAAHIIRSLGTGFAMAFGQFLLQF